jgi:hypothetical protein
MADLPKELRIHLCERFRADGWEVLRNNIKSLHLERQPTADAKHSIHMWPLLGKGDFESPTKFTMQSLVHVRFEEVEALISSLATQTTTEFPSRLPSSSCSVFLGQFGNDRNMTSSGYIFDAADCLKSQAVNFYDFFLEALSPFLTAHANSDVLLADVVPGHDSMSVAWLTRRMLKFALAGNRDRVADIAARIEREAPTSLIYPVLKLQAAAARHGGAFLTKPDQLRYDLYPEWLEFCLVRKYLQTLH